MVFGLEKETGVHLWPRRFVICPCEIRWTPEVASYGIQPPTAIQPSKHVGKDQCPGEGAHECGGHARARTIVMPHRGAWASLGRSGARLPFRAPRSAPHWRVGWDGIQFVDPT